MQLVGAVRGAILIYRGGLTDPAVDAGSVYLLLPLL
jgi:hypothetical protein